MASSHLDLSVAHITRPQASDVPLLAKLEFKAPPLAVCHVTLASRDGDLELGRGTGTSLSDMLDSGLAGGQQCGWWTFQGERTFYVPSDTRCDIGSFGFAST